MEARIPRGTIRWGLFDFKMMSDTLSFSSTVLFSLSFDASKPGRSEVTEEDAVVVSTPWRSSDSGRFLTPWLVPSDDDDCTTTKTTKGVPRSWSSGDDWSVVDDAPHNVPSPSRLVIDYQGII